jgi:hypothetical protein
VSLATPPSVRKLQRALYAKAKANPTYRFYALYDKICRKEVLLWAWSCCRAKGGSSGVDGQSFAGIEAKGVEAWLNQLGKELKEKTYRPQAVRRVLIPKPDGKQRPLGIPTIKDRVAQMAAVIVLEAIFEADLTEEQYAYRPQRRAHDAVREVHGLLNRGYTEVVDRQLRRRLRDPLPGNGRASTRSDGSDDGKAQADCKPAKDTDLSSTRRVLRLPGLHVRSVLSRPRGCQEDERSAEASRLMSAANELFAGALTLERDIDRKIGKIGAKAKIGDGP